MCVFWITRDKDNYSGPIWGFRSLNKSEIQSVRGIEIVAPGPCLEVKDAEDIPGPGIVLMCLWGQEPLLLWFSLLTSTGSRVSVHGPSYRKSPLVLLIAVVIYHLSGINVFGFCLCSCLYNCTMGERRDQHLAQVSGSSLILARFHFFLQPPTSLFPKIL